MKAAPATGFLLPVEGNPFRQGGHASEAMAAIGTTPLQDRVWVVTGATSGIGKATALGLARLGGTVVLACRDAARGGGGPPKIVPGSQKPQGPLVDVHPAGPTIDPPLPRGVH